MPKILKKKINIILKRRKIYFNVDLERSETESKFFRSSKVNVSDLWRNHKKSPKEKKLCKTFFYFTTLLSLFIFSFIC